MRASPGRIVLVYHRVSRGDDPFPHLDADIFRDQMRWLRRNCVLTTSESLRHPPTGRDRRPQVLVTFDDGYASYARVVYPILEELQIPAVNFLATRHVDDGTPFWWDLLYTAAQRTRHATARIPGATNAVVDFEAGGRGAFVRAAKQWLKSLPDGERASGMDDIMRRLGVSPQQLSVDRQVMTWDEIRATAPLTEYGGHTHTHSLLSRIEAEQLEDEVTLCRDRIESEIGIRPTLFAYPNGDATDCAKRALRRHGFELAFTTTEGPVFDHGDPLAINRVSGPRSVGELAWAVAGFARFDRATAS